MENFEAKFEKAINALEKIGREYSEARALSWHLQELRKVILSKKMTEFEGSEAAKERQALASEEYRLHLEGTKEAIGEELRLKAKYEKLQYQLEAYRSLCSLTKAQMNLV